MLNEKNKTQKEGEYSKDKNKTEKSSTGELECKKNEGNLDDMVVV